MTNHHQLQRQPVQGGNDTGQTNILEDDFVSAGDLLPLKKDAVRRTAEAALKELDCLFRQNQWENALALFYPVEEKLPEIIGYEMDGKIREKVAFALGQVNRFDEAIGQLAVCMEKRKDDFFLHNAMAYVAYNSLYAARNREIFLRGKHRAQRIELAHDHFAKAQLLRPDGVTNFYREGMLFKQIEGKPAKALPLFLKAVKNWESLDHEAQTDRHQERKKYVKALFNGASAALACNHPRQTLKMIRSCMKSDESSDYIAPLHRYFALGKVLFYLNRFDEAQKALEAALLHEDSRQPDFVVELLARTHLCRNNWQAALAVIDKIPKKNRRPYVCWTLADALAASGDLVAAERVLENSANHDGRSRHKSLIRLARITYLQGKYEATWNSAKQALAFFEENWGHPFDDGLFWSTLGAMKCGHMEEAKKAAHALRELNPDYPKLNRLLEAVEP